MDTITSTAAAAMLSWPIQYMQIQSMLSSISIDYWGYAVVPIVVCVVSVHLIFWHFFQIIWFSFKFLLSLLLYVQVRDVVSSCVGTDLLSLDSSFFGLPSGTIQTSKSIGIHLVKTRVIANLVAVCPTCFLTPAPDPIPERITDPIPSPMDDTTLKNWWYRFEGRGESIHESQVSSSSWVDMMRNVINI